VEEEGFVRCNTEAIAVMDMASKHLIIPLPVCTHFMAGHSVDLCLAQVGAASHGVEVVAESSVADGDSVVGGDKSQ